MPFSLPELNALDNWVFWAVPISNLYSLKTYLPIISMQRGKRNENTYFLICGRETPILESSGLAAIHSYERRDMSTIESL